AFPETPHLLFEVAGRDRSMPYGVIRKAYNVEVGYLPVVDDIVEPPLDILGICHMEEDFRFRRRRGRYVADRGYRAIEYRSKVTPIPVACVAGWKVRRRISIQHATIDLVACLNKLRHQSF